MIKIGSFALRLENLDCPELGTPEGESSKLRMQAFPASRQVTCSLIGDTSYDRMIARRHLADGRDLGDILIREEICTRWQ